VAGKRARGAAAGGFAFVSVLMVVVIIGVTVVFHMLVTEKLHWEVDLSQEKYYTISPQTMEVLDRLDEDVNIYSLYNTGNLDEMIVRQLKQYAAVSDRVHYENIDPTMNPAFIRQFDPEGAGISAGSVIVADESGKNYKVLSVYDLYAIEPVYNIPYALQSEQKITSTINYLETGEIPSVKFLAGQDEDTMSDVSQFVVILRALSYEVSVYDPDVPGSALDPEYDILLVVSPKEDISEDGHDKVRDFLAAGGNAVFLIDRVVLDEASGTNYIVANELKNFTSLLMLYDIKVNNDYIIGGDSDKIINKPTALIPELYEHETVTSSILASGKTPVLTDVASLSLSGDGSHSAPLIVTDQNTWAKNLTSAGSIDIKEQEGDEKGPFTVAALGENMNSNIAVYGTSSFVTQSEITRSANRDLIVNTVNSLKKGKDAVNIAPKSLIPGSMELKNDNQKTLMSVIVIVVLPATLFLYGLIVWIRRRNL
jgi:hypothetical protein